MYRLARVVVSLDIEGGQAADGSQAASLLHESLHTLSEVNAPATWIFSSFSHERVGKILSQNPAHEIALSADPAWAGPHSDRNRFSRELEQRLDEARSLGVSIHTLVLPPTCHVDGRLDLLVKHQISTIQSSTMILPQQREELARFGILVAPAPVAIHEDFSWWSGGPRAAARRAFHDAVQQQSVAHVSIHLRRTVQRQRQQMAISVLRDAVHRARYDLVEMIPMNRLIMEHRVLRTGTGHSALRAA